MAKQKKRVKRASPASKTFAFTGGIVRTISRDEIYYRLEYYFHAPAQPGRHVIPPSAPIADLWRNLTLQDLFVNINRASPVFMPAWRSQMFHGVTFPWASTPPVVGIQDVRTFGDLIECAVGAYRTVNWQVT